MWINYIHASQYLIGGMGSNPLGGNTIAEWFCSSLSYLCLTNYLPVPYFLVRISHKIYWIKKVWLDVPVDNYILVSRPLTGIEQCENYFLRVEKNNSYENAILAHGSWSSTKAEYFNILDSTYIISCKEIICASFWHLENVYKNR